MAGGHLGGRARRSGLRTSQTITKILILHNYGFDRPGLSVSGRRFCRSHGPRPHPHSEDTPDFLQEKAFRHPRRQEGAQDADSPARRPVVLPGDSYRHSAEHRSALPLLRRRRLHRHPDGRGGAVHPGGPHHALHGRRGR